VPSLFDVSSAAHALGVHPSRVRSLIAAGELEAEKIGGRWLVDAASVANRSRRSSAPGRPLVARNAWAFLLLASGESLSMELDPVARWRLNQSLRTYGLRGLQPRLVRRGRAQHYWALPGELIVLHRAEIARSGASASHAHGMGLVAPDVVDGYISAADLARFVRKHALQPASAVDANVILRGVEDDAWLLDGRPIAPAAAVALDLVEYADPRSRRAGDELIRRLESEGRSG